MEHILFFNEICICVSGNPFSFSYIPDSLLTLSDSMSFLERLENTVNGLWDLAWFNWYFVPAQDAIIKKHFKYPGVEKIPSVSELIKNISLSLVNSHFSIGYSRPFSPNMVEIAGMHLKPVQKLPKVSFVFHQRKYARKIVCQWTALLQCGPLTNRGPLTNNFKKR